MFRDFVHVWGYNVPVLGVMLYHFWKYVSRVKTGKIPLLQSLFFSVKKKPPYLNLVCFSVNIFFYTGGCCVFFVALNTGQRRRSSPRFIKRVPEKNHSSNIYAKYPSHLLFVRKQSPQRPSLRSIHIIRIIRCW